MTGSTTTTARRSPVSRIIRRVPSTSLNGISAYRARVVTQRDRAERHDVVDVLATFGVPHAVPLGARHASRQPPLEALPDRGTEQRVGSLATGRREPGNAPVAHRISPPRWPSPARASP